MLPPIVPIPQPNKDITPEMAAVLFGATVELMKSRVADLVCAAGRAAAIGAPSAGRTVVLAFDSEEHAGAFRAALAPLLRLLPHTPDYPPPSGG